MEIREVIVDASEHSIGRWTMGKLGFNCQWVNFGRLRSPKTPLPRLLLPQAPFPRLLSVQIRRFLSHS